MELVEFFWPEKKVTSASFRLFFFFPQSSGSLCSTINEINQELLWLWEVSNASRLRGPLLEKPFHRWAQRGLLEFRKGPLLREKLKDPAAALNYYCYKVS